MSSHLRRITLPSGRAIMVTRDYLIPDSETAGLHVCAACASRLVQSIAWDALPTGERYLLLECPDCGYNRSGTFTQDQVEALDDRLDEGFAELLLDLRRLAQSRMADDIIRFAAALHADLILPEDF
jgi:hypothetical protein